MPPKNKPKRNQLENGFDDLDPMAILLRERSKGSEVYRQGTLVGIAIGGLFLIGGVVSLLLGVTGTIEWIVTGGGIESRLSNAAPGAFISLLGAIILWRYKPIVHDDLDIKSDGDSKKISHSVKHKMSH